MSDASRTGVKIVAVELRCPIVHAGNRYTSIEMRRPSKASLQVTLSAFTGKPMTSAQEEEIRIRLVALLSGLPIAAIDQMMVADLDTVFREAAQLFSPDKNTQPDEGAY